MTVVKITVGEAILCSENKALKNKILYYLCQGNSVRFLGFHLCCGWWLWKTIKTRKKSKNNVDNKNGYAKMVVGSG